MINRYQSDVKSSAAIYLYFFFVLELNPTKIKYNRFKSDVESGAAKFNAPAGGGASHIRTHTQMHATYAHTPRCMPTNI